MNRNMAQCGIPGKHPSTNAWTSSRRAPLGLCLTSMNQCVSAGNLIYLVYSKLLCFVVTPGHRTVTGSGLLLLGLPARILSDYMKRHNLIFLIWLGCLNRIGRNDNLLWLHQNSDLPHNVIVRNWKLKYYSNKDIYISYYIYSKVQKMYVCIF